MPRTISRTQHLAETAVRVQPIRQFMTYDHYMRSCDTLVSQVQPSTYSRKLAQLLEQHLTERVSHLQINVYRASRNNEQLYVMLMRLARCAASCPLLGVCCCSSSRAAHA